MSTKQVHEPLDSAEFLHRITNMEVEFVEGGTPAFDEDAFHNDEDDEDDDADAEKVEKARVDKEAQSAQTADDEPPTEEQIHAGNYRKGHINVSGVDIAIENPVGTRRRPEWPPLSCHYGYINRTTGADGEQVDVFVRPGISSEYVGPVYVVDQVRADGETFDEHKVMIGWYSRQRAQDAYLSNFTSGWQLGEVTRMTWAEFLEWLAGDTSTPAAET